MTSQVAHQFVWSEGLSVGCPDLDNEHKALFRIAQKLQDAIESGSAQAELAALFAQMASYARFHFADEEAFMRRTGAPHYNQHCREHARFSARLEQFENEFQAGKANVDAATMNFLRHWMEHHIAEMDQRDLR